MVTDRVVNVFNVVEGPNNLSKETFFKMRDTVSCLYKIQSKLYLHVFWFLCFHVADEKTNDSELNGRNISRILYAFSFFREYKYYLLVKTRITIPQ